MNFDFIPMFAVIMVMFAIGDFFSALTKGKIPGVFVVSILMMIGFWTVLPKNAVELSNLSVVGDISMALILIHVGTLLDLNQLKREWRTVLTVLAAIVGIIVVLAATVIPLFGIETFAVVVPPLTGGGMAAIIMSTAAQAQGLVELAILAIMMFITQSFLAFPITARVIQKEAERIKSDAIQQGISFEVTQEDVTEKKKKLVDRIPKKYKTPAFHLATSSVIAVTTIMIIDPYTDAFIDKSIISLLMGILFREVGLIDKAPLEKGQSFGILMLGLLAVLIGYLNQSTPSTLLSLLLPIGLSLVLAILGVFIFSLIVGKKLGFSKYMAFAIGLNCFLGFPYNFAITQEAISMVAANKQENAWLMSKILPNILVAGFVSVTIVSVVIAGFFTKFL